MGTELLMKEWLTRALAAGEDATFFTEVSFAFPTLMDNFENASGAMAKWKAGSLSEQERSDLSQTINNLHGRLSRLVACYLVCVGETLAGVVLAELPGPDMLRSSAEVVAYAGLNPRQHTRQAP
jgi:hypothetical protein